MDPNVALDNIRKLVAEITAGDDSILETREQVATWALAEYVDALDKWLSSGNFLPDDWRSKR